MKDRNNGAQTGDHGRTESRISRFTNMKSVLYVPPCLTFNNSTFCPHRVFMGFVWILEQRAIISLYSIN